jgi:hypothetical protein
MSRYVAANGSPGFLVTSRGGHNDYGGDGVNVPFEDSGDMIRALSDPRYSAKDSSNRGQDASNAPHRPRHRDSSDGQRQAHCLVVPTVPSPANSFHSLTYHKDIAVTSTDNNGNVLTRGNR